MNKYKENIYFFLKENGQGLEEIPFVSRSAHKWFLPTLENCYRHLGQQVI